MEEELKALGFVTNVSQLKWDTVILPALRQYWKVYGNADVPHHFVVPNEDESCCSVHHGRRRPGE
ncbi:hypothetical protein PHYSODRAFT_475474 [Phytophthora sojae]|uniref:Uncharacterized protein n=1 Tax=Phytophthora sojae (strain P6497) TaxID=1094619 RepID=G4YI40_PHYSP|nr:hypothetical protein PHYSODRAFT_475474 [Phytophthora sojae]EGZ27051.1 hypothetical protein PHYSODRAFT_475474 [Phytophthora sojae]|eukprot:XP_009514326.1 hypothetical protein PHYSODRAFT_475474 [Phytophthora sojae]